MLENRHLTEAERRDRVNYQPGDVLQFHQNAKGFLRGDRLTVGELRPLPLDLAAQFEVFRPKASRFAPGDLVRITHNSRSADGQHRLNNGTVYRINRFDEGGNIILDNGWLVGKNMGHLTHGYVITSHASQGKTVQQVFIAQSSKSFPASSREQFYVSVSRGTERATIYTGDKEALREAISQTDERISATELVNGPRRNQPPFRQPELGACPKHEKSGDGRSWCMNVSVLDKYVKPRPDADPAPPVEGDLADDLGSFGWLRGIRERAVMLELRHRDGSITALGYGWLERADFDPSVGIILHFGGKTVKITGQNLNAESRPNVRLFSGIVRQRVPWIQEAGEAEAIQAPKGATVVEQFEVK